MEVPKLHVTVQLLFLILKTTKLLRHSNRVRVKNFNLKSVQKCMSSNHFTSDSGYGCKLRLNAIAAGGLVPISLLR